MGSIAGKFHSFPQVETLAGLAAEPHDVVVVGGGFFGAMAHLEASRRGLRSVLVEANDFGGATSAGSLRIVHGGLRYLQTLDAARSLESIREQRWFLDRMRELVEPLPCLLPLYRRGLKRASVLRLGLAAADLAAEAARLHAGRLERLPAGAILDAAATAARFPHVRRDGLEGGAVWHDLRLVSPPRVIVETLRLAARLRGVAVNYVRAERLLVRDGRVRGVTVADAHTGASHELACTVVIDAAGCGLQRFFGVIDAPDLYHSAAAWNVLLDRPPLSTHAVALDGGNAGPALFASSLRGKLLVGTGYAEIAPESLGDWRSTVDTELDAFLAAVNGCVPQLELDRSAVLHVQGGVLPATAASGAMPLDHNVVVDHARRRGPAGAYTLGGVKLTTARAAAQDVLARAARFARWPSTPPRDYPQLPTNATDALLGALVVPRPNDRHWAVLQRIVAEEAVEHLDDLIFRRTNLGDDPVHALAIAPSLCALTERWASEPARELARVDAALPWLRSARKAPARPAIAV